MKAVFAVARNEFALAWGSKIALVFVGLVVVWAVVNTLGYSGTWEKIQAHPDVVSHMETFYTLGVGQFFISYR